MFKKTTFHLTLDLKSVLTTTIGPNSAWVVIMVTFVFGSTSYGEPAGGRLQL